MTTCLNTGKIVRLCKTVTCMHHDVKSASGCIQDIIADDKTSAILQLSDLGKGQEAAAKRLLRSAEDKLVAWGKILEDMDNLTRIEFFDFVSHLYLYDSDLAEAIGNDPLIYISPPMQYVSSKYWVDIVSRHGDLMIYSKICDRHRKDIWEKVSIYVTDLTGV